VEVVMTTISLGRASVPVGIHPRDVAVNQQTNTIYVTDTGSRSVSVIAGAG
jgi:DNA-binding beta-propeller fold protein YncE